MIALSLAMAVAAQPPTSLVFKDGSFWILASQETLRVPLETEVAKKAGIFALQHKDRWVVVDERGLTVRTAEGAKSSRLPDIAVTGRLFVREETLETVDKVAKGIRQRGFSTWTGAEKIGSTLFLRLRWKEKTGDPWLESIVKVDLEAGSPKGELVGRLDGIAPSADEAKDGVISLDGKLASVTKRGDEWGLSIWDPASPAGDKGRLGEFKPFGRRLAAYLLAGESKALVAERTDYGTVLASEVSLTDGARSPLFEARGQIEFVSANPPVARVVEGKKVTLRSIESGAVLDIAPDLTMRFVPLGMLAWAPTGNPSQAALYGYRDWRALAVWRREEKPASATQPARAGR